MGKCLRPSNFSKRLKMWGDVAFAKFPTSYNWKIIISLQWLPKNSDFVTYQ
jgi:hypothetical protein